MNVNNLIMERANRERRNKERKKEKGEVSLCSTCLQEDSHDVSCDLKIFYTFKGQEIRKPVQALFLRNYKVRICSEIACLSSIQMFFKDHQLRRPI